MVVLKRSLRAYLSCAAGSSKGVSYKLKTSHFAHHMDRSVRVLNSEHPPMAVAITGRGMVSSLGLDVVTSCAAARAGIVRSEELDYFRFLSPEDGAVESLIVHMVPEFTRGFEGFARLLRIIQGAMTELQRQVSRVVLTSARTGFYLSLADPHRIHTGLKLVSNDETRKGLEKKAQAAKQRIPDATTGVRLLQTLAGLNGWPNKPLLNFVATSGHTGIAEALARAAEDLRQGQVDAAVVGGVESLLDEDTLAWLHNTGRLKTSGIPAGLQPGEAAAFFLLETLSSARAREARVFGYVQHVCLGKESRTLLSGDPPIGGGLVEVLTEVADSAGWEDTQPVWLIVDQNGEPYRATDWGNAIVRIVAQSQAFTETALWYPATSFGDTGAASGAVSICMAASAFERGYAPAQTVGIVSSADGPFRSLILLQAHVH